MKSIEEFEFTFAPNDMVTMRVEGSLNVGLHVEILFYKVSTFYYVISCKLACMFRQEQVGEPFCY